MRVLEPVQVSGHGLGAALAMLRLLENQGANVKQLYISKAKAKDDNVLAG
jgi:surfactin synthase thioesterase subunit